MNPKHPHNHWHEELCALAAIGELSVSEFAELQEHLTACPECQGLYADFRRIATNDIGLVAVAHREDGDDAVETALDEQALLSRFMDRAERERALASITSAPQPASPTAPIRTPLYIRFVDFWRQPALSYGTVALLLCLVAGVGAYRLREVQLKPRLQSLARELTTWRTRAEATQAREDSDSKRLQEDQTERASLRKSLDEAEAKVVDLQAQQRTLESRLADTRSSLAQKDQALEQAAEEARAAAEAKGKQIGDLQAQLQRAVQRTEEQERIADDLHNRLDYLSQAAKMPEPTLPAPVIQDTEARNLFGARDLHIVDVYDVDSSGKTKRTYGRVYYVEKQLLVFYAFDLQDKRHNRQAAGFQAWGYREVNENKPADLGLFYIDDAALSRWVLKVNNPKVLERVEAVFVTLEPPTGSPSPRGRRLLYANLLGPANHP
jgi:hypothetical protein